MRRHGQLINRDAGGVIDGVSDSGRGGDNRRLPQRLVAVAGRRFKGFNEFTADIRHIDNRWYFIIQKIIVIYLAGFRIDLDLLVKTGGNSHGHTAVDLALGRFGIEDDAGIMDIDDFVDLHLAVQRRFLS